MMVKRKRAPGGGRKRLGASVAQNLTIRVDDDLRGQLEAAAIARQKRNWNLTQEILLRLRTSLSNERVSNSATLQCVPYVSLSRNWLTMSLASTY
jgi:hypothetical protein